MAPADRRDPRPPASGLQTSAEVVCPCCGETIGIALDPGGGSRQEYGQDCQVCCRPWVVRVRYDDSGAADVEVEPEA